MFSVEAQGLRVGFEQEEHAAGSDTVLEGALYCAEVKLKTAQRYGAASAHELYPETCVRDWLT